MKFSSNFFKFFYSMLDIRIKFTWCINFMTNLLNGKHEGLNTMGDISPKKNEFSGMIQWMNLRELDDG